MAESNYTIQTKKSPCMGCETRSEACHGQCERYKAWKKKFTDAKKNQRDYDRILQDDIWRLLTS